MAAALPTFFQYSDSDCPQSVNYLAYECLTWPEMEPAWSALLRLRQAGLCLISHCLISLCLISHCLISNCHSVAGLFRIATTSFPAVGRQHSLEPQAAGVVSTRHDRQLRATPA